MTHITIKREVLEEALYLIESWQRDCERADYVVEIGESVDALRTALDAKDVEPVGEFKLDEHGIAYFTAYKLEPDFRSGKTFYVYDHPAPDARQDHLPDAGNMAAPDARLMEAAQAVVDRWDTPSWKDVPATAEYINALRNALEGVK